MFKTYIRLGLILLSFHAVMTQALAGQQSTQKLPPNSPVPPDMQPYQQISQQTGGNFYSIPDGNPAAIAAAFDDLMRKERLERYDSMSLLDIRQFLLNMPLQGTPQQVRTLRRSLLKHTDDIILLAQQHKLRATITPMNALIRLLQTSASHAVTARDADFVVGYFMHGARL